MFSLRRLAASAARSSFTPATFGVSRVSRPHSLAELRSFEGLLAQSLRRNSSYAGNTTASPLLDGTEGATDGEYGAPDAGLRAGRVENDRGAVPRRPNPPNPIVYVGNLPFEYDAESLAKLFEGIGTVKAAKVVNNFQGMSKGFGYVEFATTEEAAAAIDKMHYAPVDNRTIVVQYGARPRRITPNPESRSLFIGNMSFTMTDEDLADLFRDVKNCVDVRVAMDRRTNSPRGFAHADFTDVESARVAREQLSQASIAGRRLRVDFAAEARDYAQRRTSNISREQAPVIPPEKLVYVADQAKHESGNDGQTF